MNEYSCSHVGTTIIMNTTPMALVHYIDWMNTTGFQGDNSECFDCYLKRVRSEVD